jgi:hypothetical protein
MAERDTMNDNHEPTRPGWVVYIGAAVLIVGMIAIMLANKVAAPVKTGLGPYSNATLTA